MEEQSLTSICPNVVDLDISGMSVCLSSVNFVAFNLETLEIVIAIS